MRHKGKGLRTASAEVSSLQLGTYRSVVQPACLCDLRTKRIREGFRGFRTKDAAIQLDVMCPLESNCCAEHLCS